MRDIRIGCIGCGFIGGIHLRNAARMPGVSIRALADIEEASARDSCERFGAEYWTTDAGRLFADPALDAILICTYLPTHPQLAVCGARAGKHVFLEKPMAGSAAECVEIIRACRRAGVALALDLKFRFARAVQAVKQTIPEPALVVAHAAMEKLPDENLHVNPELGGGIIDNLGAHSLDLACFLAGSDPVQVFARGSRLAGRSKVTCDAGVGTLEFANGCLATFLISDCGEWAYPSKWFYEVADGERTAVIYNHCRTAVFGGASSGQVDESELPPHELGTYECLEDFLDAIRQGREPKIGGLDGLRGALIAEAVKASIESGAPVELSIQSSLP